ncbi:MAG: response regulator [Aphanocapsa sp. GSE-SYN-MK-11-07L]|jgi:diguanylate cyclase (GGDEF)-like protein|nr:response regulator [Aphanocapsa sp. GSE-SYN-MK-11-07L]
MKILVVEDDELTAQVLVAILNTQNYAVEVATDGQTGLNLVETFDYDLVLTDLILPKLDGISLCRQIRSRGLQMPILLLTGQDNGHDKAIGLDAGADDYVVKPFNVEELIARVRALLRRGGIASQPILEWGDLQLDPGSCEVTYASQPLLLTPKEYALLELFLRNHRRVFSCGMILEHLWAYEETPGEDAVRTHIKGLRQKLKAVGAPTNLIETVYGIGYRLKLQAQAKLKEQPKLEKQETRLASIAEPTLALVDHVWHQFKERVSQQVEVLEQAVKAPEQQDGELVQRAKQEAHTLAGSLGIFGLPAGSQLARQIEQVLQAERPLAEVEVIDLQNWVIALRTVVEAKSQTNEATMPDDRPLLLIVEADRAIADQIARAATTWGIRSQVATHLKQARTQICLDPANVVVLDPDIAAFPTDSFNLLADLSKQVPPVPVVVYSEHDQLADRLEFAHLGGRAFLPKSASAIQVLEAVNQVLQQVEQTKARVLVVDDDPALLAGLRSLLEPWGLSVTTLADPQHFWQTLEDCSPDLLILDVEMPHLSGIDLCQIVRNDFHWSSLPILFLTVHSDPNIVNQVFAAGADDFVSKPIVGPELVTRIINRLERIQLLRNLAETDPLTKLANRQKSTQDLENLLNLAKRQNHSLCLAILDLDRFKLINDRCGHATGDEVLRQVGHLLHQFFRTEDVVARWGGEEFVIGLYDTHQQAGVQRLSHLLELFRHKAFAGLPAQPIGAPPCLTFSAGVSQFPANGTDLHTLYQAADRALYRAKSAGRDRVFCAEIAQSVVVSSSNY